MNDIAVSTARSRRPGALLALPLLALPLFALLPLTAATAQEQPAPAAEQPAPAPEQAPAEGESPVVVEPAAPQQPTTRLGEKFDDWQIVCEQAEGAPNGEICAATQNVASGDKTVMGLAVGDFGSAGGTKAIIRISYDLADRPVAFAVAQGLGVAVDGGEPFRFNFEVCFVTGCEARVLLDEKVLTALKAGAKAGVIVTLANGSTATINVSLKGFTAALGALPPPPAAQ